MGDKDARRQLLQDPRFAEHLEKARAQGQQPWGPQVPIPPNPTPPPAFMERLKGLRQDLLVAAMKAVSRVMPQHTDQEKLEANGKIAAFQNKVEQTLAPVDHRMRNYSPTYNWARNAQEASQRTTQESDLGDLDEAAKRRFKEELLAERNPRMPTVDLGDVDSPDFRSKEASEEDISRIRRALENAKK